MRMFVSCPLVFALIALPWSAQDPTPSDPAKQDPVAHFGDVRADAARISQGLLGPWQLMRAEIPGENLTAGSTVGYALFMEGYMSLEMHFAYADTNPYSDSIFYQTGTHRWRVDDGAELETVCMIGTNNYNQEEIYDFQMPGSRSKFRVLLAGDDLTLIRKESTTKFFFKRLGKLPFPGATIGADFYGRPPKTDGSVEPGKKKKKD